MQIRIEAYTDAGIISGMLMGAERLRDTLEASDRVEIDRAAWSPLDSRSATPPASTTFATDDLLIVAGSDDAGVPVHASWHLVRLAAGPYLVDGELPTMPGFDPGRALTRPTGNFVLLRDVRVRLAASPASGEATHDHALVNRYAVDSVESDLMLGFFFPGATLAANVGATSAAPGESHAAAGRDPGPHH